MRFYTNVRAILRHPLNQLKRREFRRRLEKLTEGHFHKETGEIRPVEGKNRQSYFLEHLPNPPRISHAVPPVDVIIPVYKGFLETKRCLESLLRDSHRPPGRNIVVNDNSPDAELSAWLQTVAAQGSVTLFSNDQNLGFVATVNRGMAEAGLSDVVLLNSDTEVPDSWLMRLRRAAYSDPSIGTATPFSNNATICTYPSIGGGLLPAGSATADLDAACQDANAGRTIDIPTAVGFCMYIKRKCLTSVGIFDEQAFGKGYGEENDFCMRALEKGWKHVLACDTFVYHKGEVSFGRESPSRIEAIETLKRRYPAYLAVVSDHVSLDRAAPYRFAITAALFRRSSRPTMLLIVHSLGGGTERQVGELIAANIDLLNIVLLRTSASNLQITVPSMPTHVPLELGSDEYEKIVDILRAFGISRVHIHQVLGHEVLIRMLIDELAIPFDITVHDYYAICPQIHLIWQGLGERYCGELGVEQCNRCIADNRPFGAVDIVNWRTSHTWLLDKADRVICPSIDTKRRIQKYHPQANCIVAPHEPVRSATWSVHPRRIVDDERLCIVIIGYLTARKGREIVKSCIAECNKLRFEFRLIGVTDPPFGTETAEKLRETGVYLEADLADHVKALAPHVIWFPAAWPETYSYTLTAAIDSGLPIVSSKIGAFPERLEGRPWTWLVDADATPSEWLATFESVRDSLIESKSKHNSGRAVVGSFYPDKYVSVYNYGCKTKGGIFSDLRQDDCLSVLILPDRYVDGRVSPCGFIRLLLPLDYVARTTEIIVESVTVFTATRRIADVLVCQRHATKDVAGANELIAHCRATGMKLVYDIDDDLFGTFGEHPEFRYLEATAPVVDRLLHAADHVWVSSEVLKERTAKIRSDSILLPNQLDERIWVSPNREIPSDSPVRILYMGTATHDIDYAFIEAVADRLADRFGKRVSFEIIGVTNRDNLSSSVSRIIPPEGARISYPAFVEWLVAQSRWHIGVAPLIETPFAAAKSEIKLLDYAALRLPTVASEMGPYQNFGSHEGVILSRNKVSAWVTKLDGLVVDPAKRAALGAAAYEALLSSHSLRANGRQWVDALRQANKSGPRAVSQRNESSGIPESGCS